MTCNWSTVSIPSSEPRSGQRRKPANQDPQVDHFPSGEWIIFRARAHIAIKLEPGGFADVPAVDLADWRTSLERKFGCPREWWHLEVVVREAVGREFCDCSINPRVRATEVRCTAGCPCQ